MATDFVQRSYRDPYLGVPLPSGQLAVALRHAPASAVAAVNRSLEQRGMPTLQATNRAERPATSKAPESTGGYCGVILGTACDGLSQEDRDSYGRPRKWLFTRDAFRECLDSVADGRRSVPFRIGHEETGKRLATTANGTLRFRHHPIRGLVIEARLPDDAYHRGLLERIEKAKPGAYGLSVGFVDLDPHECDFLGERRRTIKRALLDHISLVVPEIKSGPRFKGTRVVAVRGTDPRAIAEAYTALTRF